MSAVNIIAMNANNDFEKEDKRQNNSEQPQEHTGTPFGSFINNDQASDSSIGSGSSDQGIELGQEDQEDEFRITGATPGAGFQDATNEDGSQRGNSGGPVGNLSGKYDTNSSSAGGSGTMDHDKDNWSHPKKGLVEEGPGPDA